AQARRSGPGAWLPACVGQANRTCPAAGRDRNAGIPTAQGGPIPGCLPSERLLQQLQGRQVASGLSLVSLRRRSPPASRRLCFNGRRGPGGPAPFCPAVVAAAARYSIASSRRGLVMSERIQHAGLRQRLMSAKEAATLIGPGMTVAMSGFTGAGYPKAVPQALAERMEEAQAVGETFRVKVLTGASTAPELDGVLAQARGMELRLPYQSDPALRERINAGELNYIDIHLSHVAQHTWFGFFGKIDVAVIEVVGILEDGRLIPSSSVGNNKTWLEQADKIILEVNHWQPVALEGMHDIYYGTALPPSRKPIPLIRPEDRIGEPYLRCPLEKIVAIVETNAPDRNSPFSPPDVASRQIAGHLLDFFEHEIRHGRLTPRLLPLQSGVGNITNAVLAGLAEGGYRDLTAFTEVIQDGMIQLLKQGVLRMASATSFSRSEERRVGKEWRLLWSWSIYMIYSSVLRTLRVMCRV